MTEDVLSLVDAWGPEKVVCVSDRRSGMRGVLVLDDTARGMGKGGTRMSLLAGGWLEAEPIGYEDFLPRWAAGIYACDLSGRGEVDASHGGAHRDADRLSGAMGRPVRVPEEVYAEQRAASPAAAGAALGIRGGIVVDPEPAAPTPAVAGSR